MKKSLSSKKKLQRIFDKKTGLLEKLGTNYFLQSSEVLMYCTNIVANLETSSTAAIAWLLRRWLSNATVEVKEAPQT